MVSACALLRCVLGILATARYLPQAFYSPCFFRRQLAGHRHHPSYSTSLFALKKWQPHFLESFMHDYVDEDVKDDKYMPNMAGHLLSYPQEGTGEKLKEQHGQKYEELRLRDLSVFQDCEIQNVMMCIQAIKYYCFAACRWASWALDEDFLISSSPEEKDFEYSRLMDEIMSAKDYETFQSNALEAANKGMFLPDPSKDMITVAQQLLNVKPYGADWLFPYTARQPSTDRIMQTVYLDDGRKDYYEIQKMFLVIATFKISSEKLTNSLLHRRDGDKVYLKMISQDVLNSQRERIPNPRQFRLHPFMPRKQDLSRVFRGFVVDAASEDTKNKDVKNKGDIMVRVPMVLNAGYYMPISELWDMYQQNMVTEGVSIADEMIPKKLNDNLIQQIDALADSQETPDYHPGSNGIVRDLVHPALYSYVAGVSRVTKSPGEVLPCRWNAFNKQYDDVEKYNIHAYCLPGSRFDPENWHDENIPYIDDFEENYDVDYWGRKYESSLEYQWLPTYFDVASDGSCKINDYINNLAPRDHYKDLYSSLEDLFSYALPLLESVYSYGRKIRENLVGEAVPESAYTYPVFPFEFVYNETYLNNRQHYSFRGQKLQVITKIVDYEFDGNKSNYEGVWHVEGMSHEEIVATCVYVVERDEDIEGGDILFKRAFHMNELGYMARRVGQFRPDFFEKMWEEGVLPLGKVETLEKRMIVFPNSHIHKVTTIENRDCLRNDNKRATGRSNQENLQKSNHRTPSRRRVIVFFLVNPMRRIISTREVPPQQIQAGGNMKFEDALKYRLKLMKERRQTKLDFNIRNFELCEH